MAGDTKIDGKIIVSLPMKRYILAAKNFHAWDEKYKKAESMRRKWSKKLNYYRKAYEVNP